MKKKSKRSYKIQNISKSQDGMIMLMTLFLKKEAKQQQFKPYNII